MVPPILTQIWQMLVSWVPKLIAVVIILLVGWIVGRLLGKGVSKILDKVGLDDALRKTVIGKAIEKSGVTTVGFFDVVVRLFVYLIAIFAAVDYLGIEVLSEYMKAVVEYLPSLLAGIFVIIVGFIISDFIGDALAAVGREARVEYASLFATGLKFFLYFIVLVIGLQMMKIDVSIIYLFAQAMAWGAALGIGAGLGIAVGWGFKDYVAKKAEEWSKSLSEAAKKAEEGVAKEST
ncbi:MAG: hypothetical protein DRN96_06690 [Thermoproteota archaeon]|nr:MAG: hypothetical protein DRN96_06690 [Candidatus Korarchaeota archaeon]RLG55760.1 MAG: hypothetical protein DRN99_01765 [Candidatus Korarchaeota archaeon]